LKILRKIGFIFYAGMVLLSLILGVCTIITSTTVAPTAIATPTTKIVINTLQPSTTKTNTIPQSVTPSNDESAVITPDVYKNDSLSRPAQ
jgi:hypothetical protein